MIPPVQAAEKGRVFASDIICLFLASVKPVGEKAALKQVFFSILTRGGKGDIVRLIMVMTKTKPQSTDQREAQPAESALQNAAG
jgi:hypothetical protein